MEVQALSIERCPLFRSQTSKNYADESTPQMASSWVHINTCLSPLASEDLHLHRLLHRPGSLAYLFESYSFCRIPYSPETNPCCDRAWSGDTPSHAVVAADGCGPLRRDCKRDADAHVMLNCWKSRPDRYSASRNHPTRCRATPRCLKHI